MNIHSATGQHIPRVNGQIIDIVELVNRASRPDPDVLIQHDFPQKNSYLSPTLEDVGQITGSILRVFQSTSLISPSDKKYIEFPYSWYLEKGTVLITLEGKRVTLINRVEGFNDTGYLNSMYHFQCGQAFQTDVEVSEDDTFLLPEKNCLRFVMFEPEKETSEENSPHDVPEPSRCSVAYQVHSLEAKDKTGVVKGRAFGEPVRVSEGVSFDQRIYEMEGKMAFHFYAFTSEQLNAMTKYFRDFSRVCTRLYVLSGVPRFYFDKMNTDISVRRHADIKEHRLRYLTRSMHFCVETQEFTASLVGTIEKIHSRLTVNT